jgi:hypothetical protein
MWLGINRCRYTRVGFEAGLPLDDLRASDRWVKEMDRERNVP